MGWEEKGVDAWLIPSKLNGLNTTKGGERVHAGKSNAIRVEKEWKALESASSINTFWKARDYLVEKNQRS